MGPLTRHATTLLAAAALLAVVTGARSGCTPVPIACPCTEEDRAPRELCGHDGATYGSFCDLRCAGDATACPSVDSCPDLLYEGACGDECFARETTPVELDAPVHAFLCRDRNPGSHTFDEAVSDRTLEEQVWIAYFGACT